MGRVTERVVDAVNLALILRIHRYHHPNKSASAAKDVDAANRIINETVKAINDVNLK